MAKPAMRAGGGDPPPPRAVDDAKHVGKAGIQFTGHRGDSRTRGGRRAAHEFTMLYQIFHGHFGRDAIVEVLAMTMRCHGMAQSAGLTLFHEGRQSGLVQVALARCCATGRSRRARRMPPPRLAAAPDDVARCGAGRRRELAPSRQR